MPMKKLADIILFSAVFITACALAMVAQTVDLFQLNNLTPFYFLFTAGGTVISYSLHWYFTDTSINIYNSARYEWTHQHKSLLIPFAIVGLLLSIVSFYFLKNHWVWIAVSVLLAGLYTAPKVPGQFGLFLQKIAIAKTIYLALAWTYVTAILPLIINKTPFHFTTICFILHRYFFLYALCIMFDYRDRKEDIKQGIRSLITILSDNNIGLLFYASVTISIITAILYGGFTNASLNGLPLCIAPIIAGLLYRKIKKRKNDYLYYFVVDGLMLFSYIITSIPQWL